MLGIVQRGQRGYRHGPAEGPGLGPLWQRWRCRSVAQSGPPLRPHGLQRPRPPCPSPTHGVHPNSCPLSRWCHPTITSSVMPFSSCPQSFPASGSFQMSHLFTSGGQSIGVSASASVLPMNTQDWFPLGWCWEVAKFSKWFENRESWNCYCFRFCTFLNISSKFTLDSDCFFPPNMLGIAFYFVFSASVKKKKNDFYLYLKVVYKISNGLKSWLDHCPSTDSLHFEC